MHNNLGGMMAEQKQKFTFMNMLHGYLTIVFYALILMPLIYLGQMVDSIITKTPRPLFADYIYFPRIIKGDLFHNLLDESGNTELFLYDISGSLVDFSNSVFDIALFSVIVMLIFYASLASIVWLFKKIISNVIDEKYFTLKDVKRLKTAAWIIFIIPFLFFIVGSIQLAMLPNEIIIKNIPVSPRLESIYGEWIIIAGIIAVFAKILEKGYHLKTDQELTI